MPPMMAMLGGALGGRGCFSSRGVPPPLLVPMLRPRLGVLYPLWSKLLKLSSSGAVEDVPVLRAPGVAGDGAPWWWSDVPPGAAANLFGADATALFLPLCRSPYGVNLAPLSVILTLLRLLPVVMFAAPFLPPPPPPVL